MLFILMLGQMWNTVCVFSGKLRNQFYNYLHVFNNILKYADSRIQISFPVGTECFAGNWLSAGSLEEKVKAGWKEYQPLIFH